MGGSKGTWWMSIDQDLVFPLLERLMGGGLAVQSHVCRALTDLERRLLPRILHPFQAAMSSVWPSFDSEVAPTLGCSYPAHVEKSEVGHCRFSVEMGPVIGAIEVAAPWIQAGFAQATNQSNLMEEGQSVDLTVILARAEISEDELRSLEVGDVIATGHRPDQPLQVEMDGQVRFLARPGSQDGQKAIQID
jgi:flagellar motor switch protein FliM